MSENQAGGAIWLVYGINDEKVVIVDLCNQFNSKSVTNAAEDVVAHLYKLYGDREFYYFDTEGDYAQLKHNNGVFTGYGQITPKAKLRVV